MKTNKVLLLGLLFLICLTPAAYSDDLKKEDLILDKRIDYAYPFPGEVFCTTRNVTDGTTVVPSWSGDLTIVSINRVTYKTEERTTETPVYSFCPTTETYIYSSNASSEEEKDNKTDQKTCEGIKDCKWEETNTTCQCTRETQIYCLKSTETKKETVTVPVYTPITVDKEAKTKPTKYIEVEAKLSEQTQDLANKAYSTGTATGLTQFCFQTPTIAEVAQGKKAGGEISYIVYSDTAYDVCESTWWSTEWGYRKPFTINTSTTTNLVDFPAFLTVDTATLITAGKLNQSCTDLRITDADGNILCHEVEVCNNATTTIWFKIPQTNSTTDQQFYMYYGNNGTTMGGNASCVWSNNFTRVFHLSDLNDSTGKAPAPLSYSGSLPALIQANHSYAFNFGGGADLYGDYTFPDQPYTVSLSAYHTTTEEEDVMFQSRDTSKSGKEIDLERLYVGTCYVYSYLRDDAGTIFLDYNPSGGVTGCQAAWYRFGVTTDAATSHKAYFNKAAKLNSTTSAGTVGGDTYFVIGGNMEHGDNRQMHGIIDEVRISNISRSEAWMFAEAMQTYNISAEEEAPEVSTPTVSLMEISGSYNNSILFTSTPTIMFNVTGSNETYLCKIYINDTTDAGMNTSVLNNTATNITTNITLIDTNYTIHVNCTGVLSNVSGTWNFSVHTTPPTFQYGQYETILGTNQTDLRYLQTITNISTNFTAGSDTTIKNITVTIIRPSLGQQTINLTSNGRDYSNTTTILLDEGGKWVLRFKGTDNFNLSTTADINLSVARQNITTAEGIYAYDFQKVPTRGEIDDNEQFGYYAIGQKINFSELNTQYEDLKDRINYSYNIINAKTFIQIYFEGTYAEDDSYTNDTCTTINTNFTDLALPPYNDEVLFYLIEINTSETNQANFTNKIAQCIINASGNRAPVYVNKNNTGLNDNWVAYWNMSKVTGDNSSLITEERALLRNRTSITRIYYNLTNDTKNLAKEYHNDVLIKLRGLPTITTANFSEINGSNIYDIVVHNNLSTATNITIDISSTERTGKDVWDTVEQRIIELNTDGSLNFEVQANGYALLFLDDLDHLTVTNLWAGGTPTVSHREYNRTGGQESTVNLYSAHDYKIELHDPTFGQYNQFFIHYAWINVTYVTNHTPYCDNGVIIVADKNGEAINYTINCPNSTFGYVSVGNYNNTDEWELGKKGEISDWIENYSVNIFLDGLDAGAQGVDFATRFTRLINYIRVDYGKKTITNDYTTYEEAGVGGLGEYDMKESFCGRWDGIVDTPTYSYENLTIDLQRAEWAQTNNEKQVLMAFGALNDTEKMLYCYSEYLVLFGTKNGNLYRYGQPNFQNQREIFTYNPGTELESTWKINGTEYSRRYSEGTVYIDTSNHSWRFDNGRQANNVTLCAKFQMVMEYPSATTDNAEIILNGNTNDRWIIHYTEVGMVQWASNTLCRNFENAYNRSGVYRVNIDPELRIGTPGTGLNVYLTKTNRTGVFSFYDNNDIPSYPDIPDAEIMWLAYGRSGSNTDLNTTNFLVTIDLNYTDNSQIDTVNTITQTQTNNTHHYNLTLSSTQDYSLPVWSNYWKIPTTQIRGIYWVNTTSNKRHLLTTLNTTSCDDTLPTFADTTINGVTGYGVCYTQSGGNTTWRIKAPHLSNQTFQLETDITPPTTNLSINTTLGIPYSNGTWINSSINFSLTCTDTESGCDTILYCNSTTNGCTPNINYTGVVNIGTIGETFIRYAANDTSNNNETIKNFTIRIERTPPIVLMQTQTPADITSTALFSTRLNITFNATDDNATADENTWIVYYKTNSSSTDCLNIINGTPTCGWKNTTADSYAKSNANFSFGDSKVYPQIDLLEYQTYLRNTPKTNQTLNTCSSRWLMGFPCYMKSYSRILGRLCWW